MTVNIEIPSSRFTRMHITPRPEDVVEPWEGYFGHCGVEISRVPAAITYVGWGGVTRTVAANFQLGVGVYRPELDSSGIRRAVWDAAFGYLSGFRKRDIAYFILTRSLSRRVCRWALAREARKRLEGESR